MKRWLKILLPIVVLALGVGGAALLIHFTRVVKPERTPSLPPVIETITVHKVDHQFRIRTQGTVEPRTQIQLSAEVPGRIITVSPSLETGGFFRKDEVLLQIEPRDFELTLVQALAQVENAQYRLQLEEAEAEVAQKEWDRLGTGDASPLLLRKPQLAQARATVAAAEAGLEQAQLNLDRCTLKAPFDGRVGTKMVDAGQYIAKGVPLARIYSIDFAEVRLPLSADQLAYVKLPLTYPDGDQPDHHPAVLLRASLGGTTHEWKGVITRVEGEIDRRTRMIFVVARVTDPYARTARSNRPPLASGLFVEAEILGTLMHEVFVLPRTAIRSRDTVLVMDQEGRLRTRPVTSARSDRQEVVITGGLKEGDIVCTSTLDIFTEGMKVRTKEVSTATPAGSKVETP